MLWMINRYVCHTCLVSGASSSGLNSVNTKARLPTIIGVATGIKVPLNLSTVPFRQIEAWGIPAEKTCITLL